jgi:hypothetical protein
VLTEQTPIDNDGVHTAGAGPFDPQLNSTVVQQQPIAARDRVSQLGVRRRHVSRAAEFIADDDMERIALPQFDRRTTRQQARANLRAREIVEDGAAPPVSVRFGADATRSIGVGRVRAV